MSKILCIDCQKNGLTEPGFYCTECKVKYQNAYRKCVCQMCLHDEVSINSLWCDGCEQVISDVRIYKKHRNNKFLRQWRIPLLLPTWAPEFLVSFIVDHPFAAGYFVGMMAECAIYFTLKFMG